MARYHVVLVRPPEHQMAPLALADAARLLRASFTSLGLECSFAENRFEPDAVNVMLGYHLLAGPESLPSETCVIYQLEALPGQTGWLQLDDRKKSLLRRARTVWDYSPANLALLAAEGITHGLLLPFGFHPALETVPMAEPEFDVLFYGAVNARRKAVLDALAKRCRVKTVFGVYGEKRDRLIACSRIVLNVHHYPGLLMEQARVSYLLNNRRFVVAEESTDDPYAGAVLSVPYADLAETCLRYLDDPAGRDSWAERGYEFLRARPMVDSLRPLLFALGETLL